MRNGVVRSPAAGGFWDSLKKAYGSFKVSAGKAAAYPANLTDLGLMSAVDFEGPSGTRVSATIKTSRALKVTDTHKITSCK